MRLILGAFQAFLALVLLPKHAQAFSSLVQRPIIAPNHANRNHIGLVSNRLLATPKSILERDEKIEAVEAHDSSTETKPQEFTNSGPLAWMAYYFDLFGVKEGKSIAYGPIPVDLDKSKTTSEEVASSLRSEAASKLQNISRDERMRRAIASTYTTGITIAFAIWSAVFADQGDLSGHFLRFMTVIPLFATVGYKLSAKTGL